MKRAAGFLIGLVLAALAASPALAQQVETSDEAARSATGTVRQVNYDGGYVREEEPLKWTEYDPEGKRLGSFDETHRTGERVILFDPTRWMSAEINLRKRQFGRQPRGDRWHDVPVRSWIARYRSDPTNAEFSINAGIIPNDSEARRTCNASAARMHGWWTGKWRKTYEHHDECTLLLMVGSPPKP